MSDFHGKLPKEIFRESEVLKLNYHRFDPLVTFKLDKIGEVCVTLLFVLYLIFAILYSLPSDIYFAQQLAFVLLDSTLSSQYRGGCNIDVRIPYG